MRLIFLLYFLNIYIRILVAYFFFSTRSKFHRIFFSMLKLGLHCKLSVLSIGPDSKQHMYVLEGGIVIGESKYDSLYVYKCQNFIDFAVLKLLRGRHFDREPRRPRSRSRSVAVEIWTATLPLALGTCFQAIIF